MQQRQPVSPHPVKPCDGKGLIRKVDYSGCGKLCEYLFPNSNPRCAEYYCRECHTSYRA
jgi:hypothetical protein